jgi:isoamylase
VDFITAHDGFTLNDLFSYNDKHIEGNGEDNKDDHSDNKSWNCGAEGVTNEAEIRALRERQKRNMLATLLFSQGTPMLLDGDEFGRTQKGNNNAYCQDDAISWVNWDIDDDGRALTEFVRKLTTLRHTLPVLRRQRFLTGQIREDLQLADVQWLSPSGAALTLEQWNDPGMRCFGLVIDGRAQATGIRKLASDATLLLICNAYHDVVDFTLPDIPGPELPDIPTPMRLCGRSCRNFIAATSSNQVTGRSLLLFALQTRGATRREFDFACKRFFEPVKTGLALMRATGPPRPPRPGEGQGG